VKEVPLLTQRQEGEEGGQKDGERKRGTLARRGRGSARASSPESSEAVSICSCRDLQLDFWSTEPLGRYGREREREREITGETAGASH